jgi:alpha-tubulin suppressor-like RCC1 family protein
LGNKFVGITSGGSFTCARRVDSQVYCRGGDSVGQVGRSAPTVQCNISAGQTFPCVYQPTLLYRNGAPLLLTQVDAGARHACGLDAGGNAFCWGDGNQDEVGAVNGDMAVYQSPMAVTGGRTFSNISAGTRSTCATSTGGDAIDRSSSRSPALRGSSPSRAHFAA